MLPCGLFAGSFVTKDAGIEKTWKSFNEAVEGKAQEIKQILFGPVTKIIGVLGVGYGVISMILTASPKPLVTYAGIGFLIALIPYFIDTVFGAVLP